METKEKFDWFCKTTWSKSAYNTLWCLVGCSIGDFGTIYYFQITSHSLSVFLVMLFAISLFILICICSSHEQNDAFVGAYMGATLFGGGGGAYNGGNNIAWTYDD